MVPRFVLVVGMSVCLELLILCFLNNYTADAVAFLFARSINLFIYFVGMKYFVFRSDKKVLTELKKFLLVAGVNIVVMEVVIHMIASETDQELIMLVLAVQITMFIVNALIQRIFIFSK